jgi:hypothetical protein
MAGDESFVDAGSVGRADAAARVSKRESGVFHSSCEIYHASGAVIGCATCSEEIQSRYHEALLNVRKNIVF